MYCAGEFNMQGALAANSAGTEGQVLPHHPITCRGELRFEEDGTFACEHVAVDPDNERTQMSLDSSMAMLIIELVSHPDWKADYVKA